jgi:hypothetical protein
MLLDNGLHYHLIEAPDKSCVASLSSFTTTCLPLPLPASSCLSLPPPASPCLPLPPPASSCLLLPPHVRLACFTAPGVQNWVLGLLRAPTFATTGRWSQANNPAVVPAVKQGCYIQYHRLFRVCFFRFCAQYFFPLFAVRFPDSLGWKWNLLGVLGRQLDAGVPAGARASRLADCCRTPACLITICIHTSIFSIVVLFNWFGEYS